MSEYTAAVFGSLEQGRADLTRTYASLQAQVSGLDARLRSGLAAWDDPARQAYYAARARWDAALADMAQVLSRLGTLLDTASASYQSAEAASTALWS